MDSTIYIFDKFVVRGENDGKCIKDDLKALPADFQVLIDDIINLDAGKCIFLYILCMHLNTQHNAKHLSRNDLMHYLIFCITIKPD